MVDARTLHKIPLYRLGTSNTWDSIPVIAIDDESFSIASNTQKLTFVDKDLKPNEDGKIIIDLRPLNLQQYDKNNLMPTDVKIPHDVLETRAQKRKEKALAKDAIHITSWNDKKMYFYLSDSGQLIIRLYGFDEEGRLITEKAEKEATACDIKTIYGRTAVWVKSLALGHPYLELPTTVVCPFEEAIRKNELKRLSLVLRGKSLLDGWDYYGFSVEPSEGQWTWVKKHFVEFGTDDKTLNGWLTWNPQVVAEILEIPIEGL